MPEKTARYFLQIAYRGTPYHGWQIQPTATTVQGVLQTCMGKILRREVRLTGSSRTDKGVHARQQVAHVDLAHGLDIRQLCYQANAILPPEIAIESIRAVRPHAHARFDALSRTYAYTIVQKKSPFQQAVSYWLGGTLDVFKMNKAATLLSREQDFQHFCKKSSANHHYLCTIIEARWLVQQEQLIFCIKANRFLRGMVRIIVAYLLQVGQGKMSLLDFEKLVENKEKDGLIAHLVPAQGLSLTEVVYPADVFLN